MKTLIYIILMTYKNTLKQIIKKPISIIGNLIFFGLISFNGIRILLDDEVVNVGNFDYFTLGLVAMILLITLPGIYQSINKASLSLRSADVNFLFTGPFSPAQILVYNQVSQSIGILVITVFMVLQGPLLMKFLGISFGDMMLMVGAWIVMLISLSPISMVIYSLGQKFSGFKKAAKPIFLLYIGGLFLGILYHGLTGEGFLQGTIDFLLKPYFNYLPIIGWYKGLFEAGLYGISITTIVCFLLVVATGIISMVVTTLIIDTSFYEEAVESSELIENMQQAAKSGENTITTMQQLKKKGAKKILFQFTKIGAGAVLQKEFLEFRKKSIWMVDLRTLGSFMVSIVLGYVISIQEINQPGFILLGVIGTHVYLLFFVNMMSMSKGLSKHYIYLIPEGNFKKLMAMSALKGLKFFIDAVLPTVVLAIYFRIVTIDLFLVPLIVLAFGLQVFFIDISLTTIFGKIGTHALRMYLKMLVVMLSLIPGIVVGIIVASLGYSVTITYAFVLLSLVVITSIMAMLATRAFEHPEIYN